MKKFVLLLCVCALAGKSFSQNYTDSLRKILVLQKTGRDSLLTLQKIVDLVPVRVEEGKSFYPNDYKLLLSLNARYKLIDTVPYLLMQRGNACWNKRQYRQALTDFQQAVDIFDKQHKMTYALLGGMRFLYNYLNDQEGRLRYYQKKLEYYLVNGPYQNTATCYHAIAYHYFIKGAYNQAINDYFRGAEVYRKFLPTGYINAIFVVGTTYNEWGNYDKASYYVNKALSIALKLNDSAGINNGYMGSSLIAYNEKKYNESLNLINLAFRGLRNRPGQRMMAYLTQKGAIYLALGHADTALAYLGKATRMRDSLGLKTVSNTGFTEIDYYCYKYYLAKGNTAAAEKALLAALKKAFDEKGVPIELKYMRELGYFYEKHNNPVRSEKYFEDYFAVNDAFEQGRGELKVAQYEVDQNDRAQRDHINQLKQEKAIQDYELTRRDFLLIASLAVLLLIIILSAFIYRQFVVNKKTLTSLRLTQGQLIQAEKMASLGELTAGIAHEIQNPLNFVNNFSEVSVELLGEMDEELDKGDIQEAKAIGADLKQNLEKIKHHGKRADFIVKGMLEHSRTNTGEKQLTDMNALCDEFLKLSYHGLRAKDKSFNAEMATHFDPKLAKVNVSQQDIGRVMLNLFNNAFYAVNQKLKTAGGDYKPEVTVSTSAENGQVVIKVEDNGVGIPDAIKEKIMQPFFTTKPTGEGTGLGLSLTYDMVVKGHAGTIAVDTKEGHYTEFIITLPLN